MAQYYTLDEASQKLGISGEEFRRKLATEWKTLRRFPDGNTLRFQAREIDELARTLGRASEIEIHTGDVPLTLADDSGQAQTIYTPPESGDEFVALTGDEGGPKKGSDSDLKLAKSGDSAKLSLHDSTEEVSLPKSNIPKPPSSKKLPPQRPVSDADLSLSTDSSADFDLQLTDDGSDEVDLARVTRKGKKPGDSGINLQDPADSGISLEKDSSEFELQLEPEPRKPGSSGKLNQPKSSKKMKPVTPPPKAVDDSDSEFELTLDEGSVTDSGEQKDIFETDFELPALDDSSSESGTDSALEDSDFDLSASGEESASEVVAIEEEAEDDLQPIEEDDALSEVQPLAVAGPPAKPAEWGALPIIVMVPCVAVMFFVGLMSFEMLHSMWGYHTQNKVAGGVVRTVAELMGEMPKD